MTVTLQLLGRFVLAEVTRVGRSTFLLLRMLGGLSIVFSRFALVRKEIYVLGVLSLPIITVSGLFVGMVLGLQGYNTLVTFGAEEALGVAVAKSLVRELGPVVAALLYTGRAGSAMTAQIGLMKATEQLSSMGLMAVDPIKRVLVPRFVAGCIAMPLLAGLFTAIGIWGGYLVGVSLLGVDSGAFWSQMKAAIDLSDDLLDGVLIKSLVFGFIVNWIAVYEGYDAVPTSEGISRATTRTVVNGSLGILMLDFILTALMFGEN